MNATTGTVLAQQHLAGISQTIARAELEALICAVKWMGYHQVDACIWCDSLSTVNTALRIQSTGQVPLHVENYDLWVTFLEALDLCSALDVLIRWTPSHVRPDMAEDMVEDWLIHWNNKVDEAAVTMNATRNAEFWFLHGRYSQALHWWSSRVRQVRELHFRIADMESDPVDLIPPCIEIDSDGPDEYDEFQESLPLNWMNLCKEDLNGFPSDFLISIVQWIIATESRGGSFRVMTEVEFVFALQMASLSFPFLVVGNSTWSLRHPTSLFQKPTLAMLLRAFHTAHQFLHDRFPDLPFMLTPDVDFEIGIFKKFPCVRVKVPDDLYRTVRRQVQSFTSTRPVRRAADLARPL